MWNFIMKILIIYKEIFLSWEMSLLIWKSVIVKILYGIIWLYSYAEIKERRETLQKKVFTKAGEKKAEKREGKNQWLIIAVFCFCLKLWDFVIDLVLCKWRLIHFTCLLHLYPVAMDLLSSNGGWLPMWLAVKAKVIAWEIVVQKTSSALDTSCRVIKNPIYNSFLKLPVFYREFHQQQV